MVFFAVSVLVYNIFSIILNILIFYMMDHITRKIQDEYYDVVLKRNVPFFVYLANCKTTKEYADTIFNTQHMIDETMIFRMTWVANELLLDKKYFYLECMRVPPDWHLWVYILGTEKDASEFQVRM